MSPQLKTETAGPPRLTPEQLEDLRTVVSADAAAWNRLSPALFAAYRLRCALFPATEPGEVSGNICAEGNSSPTVVHVHHHDIEAHAASFNEGYDEAMRQLAEPAEEADRLDDVRQCLVCGGEKDWRDMAIWRDADGAGHWVHPHCRRLPAPAEPAEEETKAETGLSPDSLAHLEISKALCDWIDADPRRSIKGGTPSMLTSVAISALGRAGMKIVASSPVVPAPTEASVIGDAAVALRSAMALLDPHEGGDWEHAWQTIRDLDDCAGRAESSSPTTETGSWPSLLAVPKSVVVVKDRNGVGWRRKSDGTFCGLAGCGNGHPELAPFVAIEER